MQILDGKKLSDEILDKIKNEVSVLNEKPHVAVILVGDDEASKIYVNLKKKACEKTGILSTVHTLPANTTQEELLEKIESLNNDISVNGILLQLPLPKHLDKNICINKISETKDVDGITRFTSGMIFNGEIPYAYPCTPFGVITLMEHYGIDFEGKNVVMIGRSGLVGKPLAQMLLNKDATVTTCHSKTKDLKLYTQTADILISAVGKKIITKDMIKPGAVVIDVGIFKTTSGEITGDVDFENVKEKASFITPVPGGIGPMTIASLMLNTLSLFKKQI